MGDLVALDIKTLVGNAIKNVFATMVSMDVVLADNGQPKINGGDLIVGTVSFAGNVMGSINIHVSKDFARSITAALLGMDAEEIEADEEIHDVIGELCNMVGGDLSSRFCNSGMPCKLSIPSIVSGSNFRFESRGWARKEQLGLQYQDHNSLVEVFLKPGE